MTIDMDENEDAREKVKLEDALSCLTCNDAIALLFGGVTLDEVYDERVLALVNTPDQAKEFVRLEIDRVVSILGTTTLKRIALRKALFDHRLAIASALFEIHQSDSIVRDRLEKRFFDALAKGRLGEPVGGYYVCPCGHRMESHDIRRGTTKHPCLETDCACVDAYVCGSSTAATTETTTRVS